MKKVKENLLLIVASMMCLFVMFGVSSIESKATTQGTLISGDKFNDTLKSFTMTVETGINQEKTVKKIIFTSLKPNTNLKTKKVGEGVTAYYDPSSNTIYVYCPKKIIFNSSSYDMFENFTAVEAIEFNTDIDTSKVTEFGSMFSNCNSLKQIDLKKFNTSGATNMSRMFFNCGKLESIDLSHFNTGKVTGFSLMFAYCDSLKSLNISSFNTSKSTKMSWMFLHCESLESLDLSNFDTSKVKDFSLMFEGCTSLRHLDLSSFNTSNATDLQRMFHGCSRLETIDLTGFKTSKVTTMEQMFSGCQAIKNLDLSKFNTSNVNNFRMMFDECGRLESLDLRSFVIKKGSNCQSMIDCYSITEIKSPKTTAVTIPVNYMVFEKSELAIDDNNDGIPDNSDVVTELPIASQSHRYIPASAVCEIRYYSNGGTGIVSMNKVTKGSIFTLPSCKFNAPEGKVFDRWDMGAPGTEIKITRNTNIKAIWRDRTADDSEPEPTDSDNPSNPSDPEKPGKPSEKDDSPQKGTQEEPQTPSTGSTKAPASTNTAETPASTNATATPVSVNTEKAEHKDSKQKTTKLAKVEAGKKCATLSWKKQAKGGIKGYEIQYSTDKNFKKDVKSVTVGKTKTTTKTIKKLKSGKKYFFRIRTFKKSGSDRIYSEWSKTKNIKVK